MNIPLLNRDCCSGQREKRSLNTREGLFSYERNAVSRLSIQKSEKGKRKKHEKEGHL